MDTININYEQYIKIIDKECKIINILKEVIKHKAGLKSLNYKNKTDSRGYQYITLGVGSKLYQGDNWFYPKDSVDYSNNFQVHPYYFYDLYTATAFALYKCGGISAFVLVQEVKLLIADRHSIQKIIDTFIEPLLNKKSTCSYRNYFKYIKLFLKQEHNIISSNELYELEKFTVTETKGNYCTSYFMAYVSKILGYDGILFPDVSGIYNLVTHSIKIILNQHTLFNRQTKNKYDWTNWGIHSFVFNIKEFDLHEEYIGKNEGFKAFHFYRDSLLPSIKTDGNYDFGTLNIHRLVSINKLYDKDICMKALLSFIKKHKLKFMCIQNMRYDDARVFNKFLSAEKLYSSIGDFERKYFKESDVCNMVISSCNPIILDNQLLTGNRHHFILFKHTNYPYTFLNTTLVEGNENTQWRMQQLKQIAKIAPDYIIGTLNIIKGTVDYTLLKGIGYSLNSDEIYGTTMNNLQTDYILSKIPKVITNIVTLNYKCSDHKAIICEL